MKQVGTRAIREYTCENITEISVWERIKSVITSEDINEGVHSSETVLPLDSMFDLLMKAILGCSDTNWKFWSFYNKRYPVWLDEYDDHVDFV